MERYNKLDDNEINKNFELVKFYINIPDDEWIHKGYLEGCGIINDRLKNLLISFMIDYSEDEIFLFKEGGLLASFDSKVIIAYMVGLLSRIEYESLKIISQIINLLIEGKEINSLYMKEVVKWNHELTAQLKNNDVDFKKAGFKSGDYFIMNAMQLVGSINYKIGSFPKRIEYNYRSKKNTNK